MSANGHPPKQDELAAYREALAAWRASLIHEEVLPYSGLKVKLKQVTLEDLVLQGDIPDELSGLVSSFASGEDGGNSFKLTPDNLKGVTQMFNVVIKACVVMPPIADTGDDNHLGIDEIPFQDKQAIFDWANGDIDALRKFRPDAEGDAGVAASAGESVRETAE